MSKHQKPVFQGIAGYVDSVTRDEANAGECRSWVNDDPVLHSAADLIGQAVAKGPGPEAQGILDAAAKRVRAIELRAYAAEKAIADARKALAALPAEDEAGPED